MDDKGRPLTFGSLFSGIGGMDLGLERAGLVCKWQVEIEPYCRQVLAKHWPNVPKHDDVKTFPVGDPSDWSVDLIAGGFPCQDVSLAGKGAGLDGERSGLWYEYARIIGVLRPRYVLVENVPGLLVRGIDRVLGTLATLRYDAEWSTVSACSMGAPHVRERLFIVAYANTINGTKRLGCSKHGKRQAKIQRECLQQRRKDWLDATSGTARGADGVSSRMDRIGFLGNAVVPQVAEFIGRRLIQV